MRDKTILILSPQSWGTMRISKHQYALALARGGNRVFYLNPPSSGPLPRRHVSFTQVPEHELLSVVDHRIALPYRLKFHLPRLFWLGMAEHIRWLRTQLPALDIVWSFDLGRTYPLEAFRGVRRIFHPVDEPSNPVALRASEGADAIFSVTREILENYRFTDRPLHMINHGLSDDFLPLTEGAASPTQSGHRRVGVSGNLTRLDLDRETFKRIISENTDITFECWGAYDGKNNNLASSSDLATQEFATWLKQAPNVVLHGALPSRELPAHYARMDAFLIAYDVRRDQSRGTNYHKIMEFLATGKVVISNNVTTYADRPDLVQMVSERDHNNNLPALFRCVMDHLVEHNSPELQRTRRMFAADNTYAMQVQRISSLLEGLPIT